MEVEVFILVDANGNACVGNTISQVAEAHQCLPAAALTRRLISLTLRIPKPKHASAIVAMFDESDNSITVAQK